MWVTHIPMELCLQWKGEPQGVIIVIIIIITIIIIIILAEGQV